MNLSLISLLIAFSFIGCTSTESLTYNKSETTKSGFNSQKVENVYINYKGLSEEAVKSIFKLREVPQKIIVTDFVDMTSLDNYTRLGYVLSNNIKDTIINNYKTKVIEAEVSKYFKISGNGIKILSRDINKLRATNFNVRYAVVGTYTYSDKELIIFVKLIDLKTGIIEGSYAKTFPMGSGTKMMLSNK